MATPQLVLAQPPRPPRANMRASLGKTTNPLFDAIMGGRGVNTKAACLIAAQIEEDLISKGWPTNTLYGSETQLVARFGVCRVVIREAVRILESRGTARMKRGPNGGLIIVELAMPVVLEGIHRYVHSLGMQSVQGAVCCSLLGTVHARMQAMAAERSIQPMLADFIGTLVSATERFEHEGPPGHIRMGAAAEIAKSRAEQIFRMLMRDLSNGAAGDKRLGSELDLCDRYGADRSALRQAVRVLEFEGIAVSAAGRGKGLMTKTPDPAAVCRLINCYFAAAGVPTRDAMAFFKVLSSEAVAIAATMATDEERDRLKIVRDTLDAATTAQIATTMQEAEDSQFSILREPLIDILVRCAKSYSTWSSHLRNRPSAELDESYRSETLNVISAILQGDAVGAAEAQVRKVERLDRFI